MHEAQVAHASSTLLQEAAKSNLFAESYPSKAAKAAESAEVYASWLNANGRKVDLEIWVIDGKRRIKTVVIDGKTWIRDGVFVRDPADR
jgi:hypothetical protein